MASPAKANSVPVSTAPSDALQPAAAAVVDSGLTVNIPTGPPHRDSSVTPPSATDQAPTVLADDPEDSPAAKPSTFTPQDDIKLVDEFKIGTKRLDIDSLQWDYDMRYGQIRKLNGKLWREIMETFGRSPPMQPGNVVVLHRPGMPTPVTRT